MSTHTKHSVSPLEPFRSLWRNRDLILQMTKREVVGRYRGSVFGVAWSFFNPVLMLLVYTFVFSVVFKTRWGVSGTESRTSFAIVLFVGMIAHALFAECANRAPNIILSNVNFVKKVVFPVEILTWVAVCSALFHAAVSTCVLLLAQLVFSQYLPWTSVLFPLVLLPLVLFTLGITWFLASMGVYIRDVGQTIGIITMAMLFLAPVFFPISALPKGLQSWIWLNPLTLIIEEGRKVLVFGQFPDVISLGIHFLASLVVLWTGFWWFQRTRNGFADVV